MTQQFSAPYGNARPHLASEQATHRTAPPMPTDFAASTPKRSHREKVLHIVIAVVGGLLVVTLVLFGLTSYQSNNATATLNAEVQNAREELAAVQASAAAFAPCRAATQEFLAWWNATEVAEGALSPIITRIAAECSA